MASSIQDQTFAQYLEQPLPSVRAPIRRAYAQKLSRDQRRDIQLLRDLGWKHKDIHRHTGASLRQIGTACTLRATPRKSKGRPPILTESQIDELVDFVCATRANRRLSYEKVAEKMDFGVKKDAIRAALEKRGYHRRLAMSKPPISERNRVTRLAWAQEHVGWTMDQWYNILWTDETWVTGGRHMRTWVTRKPGEEWDTTCILEKVQRKKGWMFWGSFHGNTPGPGIFWEKDWGTINSESYCAHTVPVIDGYIRLQRQEGLDLVLMQDGAPGHNANETKQELNARGITVIYWPPYSPDLNPIERVWHYMKLYLQEHYPENMGYDPLRAAVKEAWDKVGEKAFKELIDSMPARCQAVIDANGLATKY